MRTSPPSGRLTKQKAALLSVLREQVGFASAQQLHERLVAAGAEIGLSTVYRNLTALSESGMVDVNVSADGEALFKLCSELHHHHLVCRVCGKVREIAGAAVEKWAQTIAEQFGFQDVDHTVELTGTCADCSQ